MPGKPFQSCLIPYKDEIAALRSQNPPVSYARIAALLHEKYGLGIKRAAVGKFVRARAGGRKVYFFRKEITAKKASALVQAAKPAQTSAGQQPAAANGDRQPPKPKFEFKYSERYNLTRLPPEVAAARRKKLEEEGH